MDITDVKPNTKGILTNGTEGALNYAADIIHRIAQDHGWWEDNRSDGECIALMHSELSEALEALRQSNPPDKHLPHHTSLEVELADCIIRILDYAKARNLDIGGALVEKVLFNDTRPYKHGKKF